MPQVAEDRLGTLGLVSIAQDLASRGIARRPDPDPLRRSWDLILATDHFEAWAIDWPPGGSIKLHDHGDSLGAVVVTEGELVETRVVRGAEGQLRTKTTTLGRSDFLELERGCVHDVINPGTLGATSIHVYAPRLRSMTYYRILGDLLIEEDNVSYLSN
jgi:predicted metal-dependent enzyme (double-stranded beta helix superfamily)